jgi:FdrA protein
VNTSNPVTTAKDLLEQTPVIVNVGLEGFSDEMQARDVKVVHVDWRPPAGGDAELADLLSRLGS